MRKFTAVTESGNTYIYNGFSVRMSSSPEYPIRAAHMAALDKRETTARGWDYIQDVEYSEPEVGKLLYISNVDEWRISTPIVSITFEEES